MGQNIGELYFILFLFFLGGGWGHYGSNGFVIFPCLKIISFANNGNVCGLGDKMRYIYMTRIKGFYQNDTFTFIIIGIILSIVSLIGTQYMAYDYMGGLNCKFHKTRLKFGQYN